MTLGIPKGFGEDAQIAGGKHASGVLYVAPDGDVLLLRRSKDEANFGGHWALPGGGGEPGETPEQTAAREVGEEMGQDAPTDNLKPLDRVTTPSGMTFHTFAKASDKFAPKLNDEHTGYSWFPMDALPQPMHPAVRTMLGNQLGVAADMKPEEWQSLRDNFAKWTREEQKEPEHASDARYALDEKSVRSLDTDGRLHVALTPISKAAVNEYVGREIPKWNELGLDADKLYKLLRDPDELKKAADTFNNVQLLFKHIPVNSKNHQPGETVGSTGTDAIYEHPYLLNSLVVWAQHAIDAVDSEDQKELSSAYRYDADMTPGSYEGESYDGVMRNIKANHVALVKEGRAGPDVVVGDSNAEVKAMKTKLSRMAVLTQGLLLGAVAPLYAADAKPVDFRSLLSDVTAKNFAVKKAGLIAGLSSALKGKLAQDADLASVHKLLDSLDTPAKPAADDDDEDGEENEAAAVPSPVEGLDDEDDTSMDDGICEKIKAILGGKVDDETLAKIEAICNGTAQDEPAEFPGKPKNPAANDADPEAKKDDEMVSKTAMDAAIQKAVKIAQDSATKTQREIHEARSFVRPWVGEIAIACDSAEQVHRAALKVMGKKIGADVPAAALRHIIEAQSVPNTKRQRDTGFAQDARPAAGGSDDFDKMFPGASNITIQS